MYCYNGVSCLVIIFSNVIMLCCIIATLFCVLLYWFILIYFYFVSYNNVLYFILLFCTVTIFFCMSQHICVPCHIVLEYCNLILNVVVSSYFLLFIVCCYKEHQKIELEKKTKNKTTKNNLN